MKKEKKPNENKQTKNQIPHQNHGDIFSWGTPVIPCVTEPMETYTNIRFFSEKVHSYSIVNDPWSVKCSVFCCRYTLGRVAQSNASAHTAVLIQAIQGLQTKLKKKSQELVLWFFKCSHNQVPY